MKIVGQLKAILGLDKSKFEQGLNDAMQKTNVFANSIKKLGGFLAAAFSISAITGFIKSVLVGYDAQAKAEQKLLVALKGREDIQKSIIRQAQNLQRVTLFGDEESVEAAARLAMILGTNEAAIKRLLPLVQDLATAKFEGNLVTAAELVAKSVGSSTNALARHGIVIEGTAGSASRLESAIRELNKQVGGQAEAAARVGIGAFTQLNNIIGDLKENLGKKIMEQSWVQNLFEWGRMFMEIYQQPGQSFLGAIWKAWTKPNETIEGIRKKEAEETAKASMETKKYEKTIADLRTEIQNYKDQIEETTLSEQGKRDALLKQIADTEKLIEKLTSLKRELVEINKISIGKPSAVGPGIPEAPGLRPFGGTAPSGAEISKRQIASLTEELKNSQEAVLLLSNAFETLFTATEDRFKSMMESIINGIKRLVAELLARATILTLLNVLTGGSLSFGKILKISAEGLFPSLPKASSGGIVPPGFPRDTYPALLSSGETVLTQRQLASLTERLDVRVFGTITNRDLTISGRRSQFED